PPAAPNFSSRGLSRPATPLTVLCCQDVDARHKAGHDGVKSRAPLQLTVITLTVVPARTGASVFTSPSAFAKTLHGLASRVSSPRLMGVRPKPMAIAGPSGQ